MNFAEPALSKDSIQLELAQRYSIQALLNCYCREIAAIEYPLEIVKRSPINILPQYRYHTPQPQENDYQLFFNKSLFAPEPVFGDASEVGHVNGAAFVEVRSVAIIVGSTIDTQPPRTKLCIIAKIHTPVAVEITVRLDGLGTPTD